MNTLGRQIQLYRGNLADLPILLDGEPACTTDTNGKKQLWIGSPTGNQLIQAEQHIIDDLVSNDPNASLSARQGKILKDLIDAIGAGGGSVNVVDNLLSDSPVSALSARQGKILNTKIANQENNVIELENKVNNVQSNLTTHEINEEVHLQAGERNNWNNKADKNLVGHYIDIVLNAGWAKSGLHIPPSMYKDQFGYVTIAGMFRREDESSNNVIANLPVEYRPKIEIMSVGMKANQPFAVYAGPDGRLMVTTSGSGFYEFSMTYPTAAVR